jgi:hypothetical protein
MNGSGFGSFTAVAVLLLGVTTAAAVNCPDLLSIRSAIEVGANVFDNIN